MSSSSKDTTDKIIPLKDIEVSTNNFAAENLIGEGGFGKVYKGKLLWSGELIDIAARKLHRDYGQGDLEFWHEISLLSNLEHENLVSFIGYCDEKGEKIIVTKYEANKSLDQYLKDTNLTWTQRLQICVKIARAMKYLHDDEGHGLSVIHRNIKSSKVLLDQNWEPKLSGFGVSVQNTRVRKNRLHLAEVVGTNGYVDPIYEKTGFVTHKSDVYSFGVLLFEMLCGMKAFVPDNQREEDSPQFLDEVRSYNNGMAPIKSNLKQPSIANKEDTESSIPTRSINEPSQTYGPNSNIQQMEYGSQPPMSEMKQLASSFGNNQPPSFTATFERYRNRPNSNISRGSSYHEGQPSSFVNNQPTSFANSQPTSFANNQPTSFANSQPTSFASITS